MKKLSVLLMIISLIPLTTICMDPKTPLELFFEDPISEFNSLQKDIRFYVALYYLKKVLKKHPQHKEEITSSKAVNFLNSNPTVFNYVSKKIITAIEQHSTDIKDLNFTVYKLIFNNINDPEIAETLPHPDLFEINS